MSITFEPDFTIRPIRVRAEPLPDGTWRCQCTCVRQEVWTWGKLPKRYRAKCPMEDCPFKIIVFVMIPKAEE